MCTVRPHIETARVVGADVIARLRAGVVVLVVHLDASIIGARDRPCDVRGDDDGSDGRPVAAVAWLVIIVISASVLVVVVRLYRARKCNRKWSGRK